MEVIADQGMAPPRRKLVYREIAVFSHFYAICLLILLCSCTSCRPKYAPCDAGLFDAGSSTFNTYNSAGELESSDTQQLQLIKRHHFKLERFKSM